jgi:hypothetical protein
MLEKGSLEEDGSARISSLPTLHLPLVVVMTLTHL